MNRLTSFSISPARRAEIRYLISNRPKNCVPAPDSRRRGLVSVKSGDGAATRLLSGIIVTGHRHHASEIVVHDLPRGARQNLLEDQRMSRFSRRFARIGPSVDLDPGQRATVGHAAVEHAHD